MANCILFRYLLYRGQLCRCKTRHISYFYMGFRGVAKDTKGASSRWFLRQVKDPYVQKAKQHNYRARSAFKLIEIDDKYHFLRPGLAVIDIGAAPGAWSQVAAERVNSNSDLQNQHSGMVIGVDKDIIRPWDRITFFEQMDFTHHYVKQKVTEALENRPLDVVLCDIAPNRTGDQAVDHIRLVRLVLEHVYVFTVKNLSKNGVFLAKLLQGQYMDKVAKLFRQDFRTVHLLKPPSSRDDSAEIFLLAQGFSGHKK